MTGCEPAFSWGFQELFGRFWVCFEGLCVSRWNWGSGLREGGLDCLCLGVIESVLSTLSCFGDAVCVDLD